MNTLYVNVKKDLYIHICVAYPGFDKQKNGLTDSVKEGLS